MSNFITLTFDNTQPTVGQNITLTQEDTLGVTSQVVWDYVSIFPQSFEIPIVLFSPQDITNAESFEFVANRDLNPALYSVIRVNNVVTITALNESIAFSGGVSTFTGITFEVEFDLTVTVRRINVRSPFFISSPVFDGANLVSSISTEYKLFIYEGVLNVSKPSTPTYTYTKKPRFLNDNNIYIDISRQVNDFINNTYNGTLVTQSVFVDIEVNNTYNGGVLTSNNVYLAVNGFNLHSENVNHLPSNDVLISNRSITVLKGKELNIPFYRSGGSYSIEFRNNTSILDTQTITAIPLLSTNNIVQNITYLNADLVNNVRILNTDTQEETFIDVEVVTECIYDPVKITFVNRHGVLQDFYSYKVSKEQIKSTSDSYNRSILNEDVISGLPILSYSTTEHRKREYNKQATKSIELNTGYLPEDNNILIEEMLESEYIWLTLDNEIKPVNLTSKSVSLLTKTNDQLIKYKLNFDFSYNEVQNIR